MAGMRGRPRKVALTEPTQGESFGVVANAIEPVAEIGPYPPHFEALRPEMTNPVVAPLGHSILTPRNVRPTPERMTEVLDLLKPALERGFEVETDPQGICVTIKKGRCAECLNITNTNTEFMKALNRVNVAWAAAGRSAI